MASAFSSAINNVKYLDISVKNAGAWVHPKEVWVRSAGVWVEPKEIWVKDASIWKRATNQVKFLKFNGTSSYLNCGAYFNNYLDAGATSYYEMRVIFTSFASIQTLFSYGTDPTYFTIQIGTDGRVYVLSRFNSGTAWSVNHATALSLNTIYNVRVECDNDGTVAIRVRNSSGGTVGTDFSSGNISFSLNSTTKYIGKKYNDTNYFSGYLLHVNMFGGTNGGTDYRHDNNYLASSTIGSATVTDTYTTDGTQNLTGTNVVVAATG